MRRIAALVLVAVSALPAGAAPGRAPVCMLLRDPAGDTYLVRDVVAGVAADALDVTSADVAADGRTLTAVVRLTRFSPPPVATAPTGYTYTVSFGWVTPQPWQTYLYATVTPAATTFGLAAYQLASPGTLVPDDAGVTGVVDRARNEIRISVPLERLRRYGPIQVGTAVEVSLAASARSTATGHGTVAELYGDGVLADTAERRARYVVGTPSCVRPGA